MDEVVDVAFVVTAAMLADSELAVAAFIHPVLSRLDDETHVRAAQPLARVLGRAMPFWYAGAVLPGVASVIARPALGLAWWLALTSSALLTGSVVFTLIGLLPINNRVATWDLGNLPADWRAQRERWDRLHRVRVVMLVVAAVLAPGAAVLGPAEPGAIWSFH